MYMISLTLNVHVYV